MIRRRASGSPPPAGLSSAFDDRLRERLGLADSRRRRRATLRRWKWTGWVVVPLISAICWAVVPWTFEAGARALIGLVGYVTLLLSVANSMDRGYLAYLGLSTVPVLIDVVLLIGVVSWLMWASRSGFQPAGTDWADSP